MMAEAKVTKVIVRTNDGRETEVNVTDYDAAKIADLLNNATTNVVAIGDMVVQRSYVIGVRPVSE